jgi:ABC-type multidrug transport system permease subunit
MMSRAQIVLLQLSMLGMTVSGGVFALMKYAMKSDDPFAVVNHPWQPYLLSAHVLIGPFAVFALGWIFGNHIWPAFVKRAPNRASGIVSMLLIVPMTLSGYLMQVSTADATRKAFAVTHWVSVTAFVVGYVAHLVPVKRG